MKTVPLRLSHLPDSGGIFTLSNGRRMKKISRSIRQAKQAKIWCWLYLFVQSVQSVRSDVAGPYIPYDDDMVVFDGFIVSEFGSDTCLVDNKWYEGMWPNPWVPRVPRWLVHYCYIKLWESVGFDPRTSPHYGMSLHIRPTNTPTGCDLTYNQLKCF